jgi:hypothetical protein
VPALLAALRGPESLVRGSSSWERIEDARAYWAELGGRPKDFREP